AVTLFIARARSVRPNFSLDDHPATASAVVEICRVLDGIPLGIELASARMAVIDVRDRLGDRFRLLEGAPAAPPRQRSLSDLVHWSVELLDVGEREVLGQASVFSGGFDLSALVPGGRGTLRWTCALSTARDDPQVRLRHARRRRHAGASA